jgi:hypothetical protein
VVYDLFVGSLVNIVDNTVNIVGKAINIDDETVNVVDNTVNIDDETVNVVGSSINVVDNTVNIDDETVNVVGRRFNVVDETVNVVDNIVSIVGNTVNIVEEIVNIIDKLAATTRKPLPGIGKPSRRPQGRLHTGVTKQDLRSRVDFTVTTLTDGLTVELSTTGQLNNTDADDNMNFTDEEKLVVKELKKNDAKKGELRQVCKVN